MQPFAGEIVQRNYIKTRWRSDYDKTPGIKDVPKQTRLRTIAKVDHWVNQE